MSKISEYHFHRGTALCNCILLGSFLFNERTTQVVYYDWSSLCKAMSIRLIAKICVVYGALTRSPDLSSVIAWSCEGSIEGWTHHNVIYICDSTGRRHIVLCRNKPRSEWSFRQVFPGL